jgi:hypothetical protein|tara:strand:- start:6886 stop:7194 length:309 start_codon:yes stop_codon:yes gene_type:complete
MTPEEYIKLRTAVQEIIDPLQESIEKARDLANLCSVPEERRKAKPSDIVEGAVIWHWREEKYGGWYWDEVYEVRHPNDDFKAYVSDSGCLGGLYQAWVRSTC